ncbi:MAG: hypothetical protein IPP44_24925 [Ideonella sp.]|nr:hypothetical protein [Ideonella sp.]
MTTLDSAPTADELLREHSTEKVPGSPQLPAQARIPKGRPLRTSTNEAYAKDVALFIRFGGAIPCNAAAVMRYLELLRTKVAPMTAYRRVMAIQWAHHQQGRPSPTADPSLRLAMRGLQRGTFPPKPGAKAAKSAPAAAKRTTRVAKPMTRQLLDRVLDAVHRNMLDRRDRALLLLGFMAGLKRTALTAIDVCDIAFTADAMIVKVKAGIAAEGGPTGAHGRSPGPGPDRGRGQDRSIAVPITGGDLCAATAVRQLIEHLALLPNTPLFRSYNRAGEPTENRLAPAFVSCVVKNRLKIVCIDPKDYSGESLRVGRLLELTKGVM